MAQFRGTLESARGNLVTRLGSKRYGLTATVDGWCVGLTIQAVHVDGLDELRVYITRGSNGAADPSVLVGSASLDAKGVPTWMPAQP